MWTTRGTPVGRRGREEIFEALRRPMRRFPACGRTSVLCSLDRRRAIAENTASPARGSTSLTTTAQRLRPTHPWPRLPRRSHAGRLRALASARHQRLRRPDRPDAVLCHHRRPRRARLTDWLSLAHKQAREAGRRHRHSMNRADGASPPPSSSITGLASGLVLRPHGHAAAAQATAAGPARRHRRHHRQPRRHPALAGRARPAGAAHRSPRAARRRGVHQRLQRHSSRSSSGCSWRSRISAICSRDDDDYAGVVVTSGTDTLEELAYFLHLTVRSDKPVVVVGSMRPPDAPVFDGAANLAAAVRVAAAAESRGPRHAGRDERGDPRRARRHQGRRAAADAFQSRGRTPRRRRRRSRGLHARRSEKRGGAAVGVRRADAVGAAARRRAARPTRARRAT